MAAPAYRQPSPSGLRHDPAELTGQVLGELVDLAQNHPHLLVRRTGCEAGDLSGFEAGALALLAYALLWGRLVRFRQDFLRTGSPAELVGLIIGDPGKWTDRESEPAESAQSGALSPEVEGTRALFARESSRMLGRLRRRGCPESDPEELLMAAARCFAFLHEVAGGAAENTGMWAARWKRVIPLLREEIARSQTGRFRPGQVVAELVALRVFYRAATEGWLTGW